MKKIFSELAAYALDENFNVALRFEIRLKENVDKDSLYKAVKFIEKRCPYFKTQYIKKFDALYIDKNDRDFVVRNTDKAVALNCEDSNYHPIAFSYYENTIYIDAFHANLDGTGILRLAKNLMYQYCINKYGFDISADDVWDINDTIDKEEYCDPYYEFYKDPTLLPEIKESKTGKLLKTDNLNLISEGKVKNGEYTRIQLAIDQSGLMKYCSSFDGSPATVISLFMARAVHNIHKDSHKAVKITLPVNLRPVFGFDKSNITFIHEADLIFNEKLWNKDLTTQGTVFRGMVIRQSQEEYLTKIIRNNIKTFAALSKIPSYGLKHFLLSKGVKQVFSEQTFGVSYSGRCLWGDMEKYINDVYLTSESRGTVIAVQIIAMGDKFYLTIAQDFAEKIYFDAFLKELDENDIRYRIDFIGDMNTSRTLIC